MHRMAGKQKHTVAALLCYIITLNAATSACLRLRVSSAVVEVLRRDD